MTMSCNSDHTPVGVAHDIDWYVSGSGGIKIDKYVYKLWYLQEGHLQMRPDRWLLQLGCRDQLSIIGIMVLYTVRRVAYIMKAFHKFVACHFCSFTDNKAMRCVTTTPYLDIQLSSRCLNLYHTSRRSTPYAATPYASSHICTIMHICIMARLLTYNMAVVHVWLS